MMKFFKSLFLVFVCSICVFNSFSQGNTGIFVSSGMMFYNGDLTDNRNKVFTNSEFFHPYISLGVTHWLSGHLELAFSYTHGKVDGADSVSREKNNTSRNLSFQSNIDEVSLRFEMNSAHRWERNLINPYVFAGVSFFHFNPQAELNGTWYDLQPLGTEGQYISNGNYEKPYELNQFAIPLGFGMGIRVSKKIRVKIEFCHRLLFTDYLDDVSTVYPDNESLSATSNGQLAVALSSRRPDGKYPQADQVRGNSKSKDTFSSFGLTLVYNPGIAKCPASFK